MNATYAKTIRRELNSFDSSDLKRLYQKYLLAHRKEMKDQHREMLRLIRTVAGSRGIHINRR